MPYYYSEKYRESMESISFLVSIIALIELVFTCLKTLRILMDPNPKIQDGLIEVLQLIVYIFVYWETLLVFSFIRNLKK